MRGPSERIRMVFLGCGHITAAHSRTLRALGGEVQCFYASRDALKSAAFEERFRGGGSFGSYEAALADGRMQVAFVATPPASHLPLTLRALETGKDVIVEKPPFLSSADFERVRAAQRQSGRRVLVAENYAYKPLARVLHRLVSEEAIGELRFAQINALKSQPARDWRADPAEAGGGALFEGGVHWIDLLAHLGPEVRRARVVTAGDGTGVERSSLVVLEFAGGAVGTLAHSWEVPGRLRGLQLSRLSGTRGTIVFESNGLFVLVSGAKTRLILPGLGDLTGVKAMFRDFLSALRTGREPLMTLDRAQRGLEIARSAFADRP
jgi:predicted dehydrogenase